ncbi:MAG: hypothetical protein LBU81_01945 [Methanosarcinales archaeon]|nr:hypothetical protein [Methanosarcinales archaeon]
MVVASRRKVTWIEAIAGTLVGWTVLYILYSAIIPHFDNLMTMALGYGVPEEILNQIRLYLVIALIIIGIVLFLYMFLAALLVEFDQYQSY